jgi:hypothetical protein
VSDLIDLPALLLGLTVPKLRELCQAGSLTPSSRTAERQAALTRALSPEGIVHTYNNLSNGEKALIYIYVLSDRHPDEILVSDLAKKYHIASARRDSGVYAYVAKTSAMNVFFLYNAQMHDTVFQRLKAVLPSPLKSAVVTPPEGCPMLCRSDRISDFSSMALYFASNKVATDAKGMATKAALAKMREYGNWDDIAQSPDGDLCSCKEAKKSRDMMISPAMFLISTCAGYLDEERDNTSILSASDEELASHAYNCYLDYDEVTEIVFFPSLRPNAYSPNWLKPRKFVDGLLRDLPIGKFVDFESFQYYARLKNYRFATDSIGDVVRPNLYQDLYYSWAAYERRLLDAILRCYCALGIVDLTFTQKDVVYDEKSKSIEIHAIRFTSFGAHLMGMKSDYVPKPKRETESGLVVTPDFYIHIVGKKAILENIPYFSQFFTQNRGSDESVSFKIELSGLFKALDLNITGEEVLHELESASSKPLPENVVRTWEGWVEKSSKISIRKVTLIDMDDRETLSEWSKQSQSEKLLFDPIGLHSAEIQYEDIKKIKRMLEKDGKYVNLE